MMSTIVVSLQGCYNGDIVWPAMDGDCPVPCPVTCTHPDEMVCGGEYDEYGEALYLLEKSQSGA